jgi:inorganic pyrophosphatase
MIWINIREQATMGNGEPQEIDDTVDVLVEIPRGSRNKYEFDHKKGRIKLDRVLYSSVHYPTDYGLIPETLSPDGDELDALIMVEEPTFPGCLVTARPIGLLVMEDEKGEDDKILAVPYNDPRFAHVTRLSDVADHWLREIENFFATYKYLQAVQTELKGWEDVERAWRVIHAAADLYRQGLEFPRR